MLEQNPRSAEMRPEVLEVSINRIVIDMRRMGSGYGGKSRPRNAGLLLCQWLPTPPGVRRRCACPRMGTCRSPANVRSTVGYDVGFDLTMAACTASDRPGRRQLRLFAGPPRLDRRPRHVPSERLLPRQRHHQRPPLQTNTASNTAYRGFDPERWSPSRIMDAVCRPGRDRWRCASSLLRQGRAQRHRYHQTVEHNLLAG